LKKPVSKTTINSIVLYDKHSELAESMARRFCE